MFTQPDPSYHGLVYVEHYGAAAFIGRCRSVYQRTMGAVLSPLSAFLLLQGIETVALRVERHVENARRVAEFLRDDPRVDSLNYAGFPDNPYYALAQKYLAGKACSLMTFEVRGIKDPVAKFELKKTRWVLQKRPWNLSAADHAKLAAVQMTTRGSTERIS